MNIRLTINKSTLDVTCDDSSIIINEVYDLDDQIFLEIVNPENSSTNVYEHIIIDRSVT